MSSSNFTIYQLNTDKDWQEIVDEFNEGKEENKQFKLKTNRLNVEFEHIKEYKLYTRAAETTPDWANPLSDLVEDLGEVRNINNSYVLFLKVDEDSFAAAGGFGYSVVASFKNFNFGIELLSRLIKPDEGAIKRISDRRLAGNIVGGDFLYHQNVSLNTEKGFNRFMSEIYTALPKETIEEKLGIKININKKNYRFLAKESINLSKAITIKELDQLVGSISHLLKLNGYSINPISYVNEKDPKISELNNKLIELFRRHVEEDQSDQNFRIAPFYNDYDSYFIMIGKDLSTKDEYDSEEEIINYLKQNVSLDKQNQELLNILKGITLTAVIENDEGKPRSLYEHLDARIQLDDKTYWLMDGNWFFLAREFVDEINNTFLSKFTNQYNQDFMLDEINEWMDGEEEGDFNFSHNEKPSVYVLDKIYYKNIEICDLLVVDNDKLHFIVTVK